MLTLSPQGDLGCGVYPMDFLQPPLPSQTRITPNCSASPYEFKSELSSNIRLNILNMCFSFFSWKPQERAFSLDTGILKDGSPGVTPVMVKGPATSRGQTYN